MKISRWIDIVRASSVADAVGLLGTCTYCRSAAVAWKYAVETVNGTTVIGATAVCHSHQASREVGQREAG
jgi:hypothetical protein